MQIDKDVKFRYNSSEVIFMLVVNQIKCSLDQTNQLKQRIALKLKAPLEDIMHYEIIKESIDARKEVSIVYSCLVNIKHEQRYLGKQDVSLYHPEVFSIPQALKETSPIVIGFGPSGMFAALTLAQSGLKPIIFERGSRVEKRLEDVEKLWKDGIINPESNVQFGEGGAGTFSDGKLTTRSKDLRIHHIFEMFIEHGAKEEIRYKQHPHIGTDCLVDIVRNIRNHIVELGGTFYFDTKVESLLIEKETCIGICANGKNYYSNYVVLAIGHSAYDTLKSIYTDQVYMEAKDFAVGVRVEHPQQMIDKNQYKQYFKHPLLKASEYRLTYQASNARGVYSFCMCPGGYVVASNSNHGEIVTNGMSKSKRDHVYANSAILVQVKKEDYYKNSVLDGIDYLKKIEQQAYLLGGSNYYAPCCNIKDFVYDTNTPLIFKPTYLPGVKQMDMNSLFSTSILLSLKEALLHFDKKIPGFIEHGVMIAPETRSSSVVRILRNEQLESLNTKQLYPCGEGAGYAGGITSSALDGLKVAIAIIEDINKGVKQ